MPENKCQKRDKGVVVRRKIYDKLLEWKHNRKGSVALMIEGARRIGKSYIVEEFGRKEYASYILVDFNNMDRELSDIFEQYLSDLDQFFVRLQVKTGIKLIPRRSLIIFDEVQLYPKARAAIKYLVKDGRYDYIETGSLISIKKNVKDIIIPSEEHSIRMFPMDFEEFLWAAGDDMLMPFIKECFERQQPMGSLHRKAMDALRLYMIVGGMPQAVEKYVETQDFDRVDEIKRDILSLYRNDIRKYADAAELRVTAVYDRIPGQLQKHEKKFRLSALSPSARMREYEEAFLWLSDAGIINCCYNTTEPSIGLRLNDERTTLKCYMGDTGLLISHAFDESGIVSEEIYRKLLLGKLETNKGMIVENLVAQMLSAGGHMLYFFSRSDNEDARNRMEIDFLIAKSKITSRHNISPIEVKSGKNYTLNSLRKCIAKYGNCLSTPYVVHDGDLRIENGITFLPLYMVPFL